MINIATVNDYKSLSSLYSYLSLHLEDLVESICDKILTIDIIVVSYLDARNIISLQTKNYTLYIWVTLIVYYIVIK